ncbi:MAG: alanine racemase [Acidimicrobiia bacterium]|jgi:D-serine deaminase-like pyridoxal phosphate-dependent protein
MEHLGRILESTGHLPTPFLAIDETVMAGNIRRMQAACDTAGIGLRPHIKTHKSAEIARRQLDAGAVGVTCATLSEAIALGEAGCPTDVYVSTPIFFDHPKRVLLERAVGLHSRVTLTADSTTIAGSTPTAPHALAQPVTELRPGTYVFGDHQQVTLGACRPEDLAAVVVSTVIHVSDGRFVIDAGAKALSKDRAEWLESYGHVVCHDHAVIDRLNDNHGMVEGRPVDVGERVMVVPNHICPVVNLFDELVMVGEAVRTIPVELRGSLE